ncbi:MAG TPA: nucleoside-diphosphate kinase [Deltaproteobacteria bacterium]|nr:nucleoside-diphosphate kinase [Deltaproteobacteria bacterium]
MAKSKREQTLVLIKPDALKNSLTGYVLSQLSEFHTGLRFAGTKIVQVSRMLAEEHYAEHKGKSFFSPLIEYIMGVTHYPKDPSKRRVVAIVYQGKGVVDKIRDLAGPTNPLTARLERPGSIRSLGSIMVIKDKSGNVVGDIMENLIHASATNEEAEREIKLWFRPNDIPPLMRAYPVEESDQHYYYKEHRIYVRYTQGSACILAPGDIAWKSDLASLRAICEGKPVSCSIESIAVKYLINEERHAG